MEDDDFVGFEMPLNPPQMEAEANKSLADLIMEAPPWDANFAIELVTLARRHLVIRSLLGFPLELAKSEQTQLMSENDEKEIFRQQGAARALIRCNEIIYEALIAADEYLHAKIAQKQEEEDADSPQSPQHVP